MVLAHDIYNSPGACKVCGSPLGWFCGCASTDRKASDQSQRRAENMVMREQRHVREGGYVTEEAIYVDRDGNQVEEGSSSAVQQLYGAGATLSAEDAKRFGVRKQSASKAPGTSAQDSGMPTAAELARILGEFDQRISALENAASASAGDEGGMVGKNEPAPENKSGVPVVEETKTEPTPANKGNGDTSQGASGTGNKRKA